MKSIKKNSCGCIIHIVEIELGTNSQFFVEIPIMTRPPIYLHGNSNSTATQRLHDSPEWPMKANRHNNLKKNTFSGKGIFSAF